MKSKISVLFLLVAFAAACSDADDPAKHMGVDSDTSTLPDMEVDAETDMGEADMDPIPPDELTVACDVPVPSTGTGLCDTTPGGAGFTLYHVGAVLAPDVIYEDGYVLVNQVTGRIACTGCDCADSADAQAATRISCRDAVLSPALINTHEHMTFSLSEPQSAGDERFDHRHDWREGIRGHTELGRFPGSSSSREAMMFIELRNIFAGTVSIAGQSSNAAQGLARNLEDPNLLEGLDRVNIDYRTFPLGDSSGTLRSSGCNYGNIDAASRLSADIYMPHVAEGIDLEARNEFLCLSSDELAVDLLKENTSIVHGIGLTADDIAEFAAKGAKLIWSPRSNMSLYGMTARVQLFKHFGVTIALGTDWSPSGSADMLRELKCADFLNQDYYNKTFTDRELWQMATGNAAISMALEDQIGSLKEGLFADLALFELAGKSPYRAIIDAGTREVALVTRAAEPLLGDANIVEALITSLQINACETLDVCGRERRLCAERDTGLTLAAIKNGVHPQSYGPFFCDEPPNEPTCVPFRPGEFTEGITALDSDGDGIPDDEDNCPYHFNPIRPIEAPNQANIDEDEFGDECDLCPLTIGDVCEMYDPNDRDGDGIPNGQDNCPGTANPDQADRDGDGIGDACDPCPDYDNTNDPSCPASIYEIRTGIYPAGALVTTTGLVTAVKDGTAFMQVSQGNGFNGVDNSGLQVYFTNGSVTEMPAIGDQISVMGSIGEFGGALQLELIREMNVGASGVTLPAPVDVTPQEVTTGGARASTLLGVLVRVTDVTVTSSNPDAPNDFKEFEVDGLRVDDFLFEVTPRPEVGQEFASLIGIHHFSFGNAKLLPRSAEDVLYGAPELGVFAPSSVAIEAGASGSTLPPLEITLSGPALGDTTIDLTYSAGISGPAIVIVPNGASRAEVVIVAGSSAGTEQVTATYDSQSVNAAVNVYDDNTERLILSISPLAADIQTDGSGAFVVTLNVPAGAGGAIVNITTTGDLSAPDTLIIQDGDLTGTFMVQAPSAAGTGTVQVELNGSMGTASVTVIEGVAGCLIISEYIEGSGSNNKALELFNCSPQPLQLSPYGVCLISNANSSCGQHVKLPSKMLGVGEVHTLCRSKVASATDPLPGIAMNCDQESGGVMNHNGDDRFIVFIDEDNNGTFGSGDTVVDAFGQSAVRPTNTSIWADRTLRRCNLTPYDGLTTFAAADYFVEYPNGTVDDFGIAPSETPCN